MSKVDQNAGLLVTMRLQERIVGQSNRLRRLRDPVLSPAGVNKVTGKFSNDNSMFPPREPDPHGQAAILLVQSLIHNLIEQNILTIADAVEIVDVARNVKSETGPDLGDSSENLQKSIAILNAIGASLRSDIPTLR